MKASRRTTILATVAAAVVAMGLQAALTSPASAAVTLTNPTCATDTAGWTASTNATVTRQTEGGAPVCESRAINGAGLKTISIQTDLSASVPTAGRPSR